MTKKEFFEELAKVDKKYYVPFLSKLGEGTSIGRVRLYGPGQEGLLCPITAVCYSTTSKFFHPGDAEDAGVFMGLNKRFTCKVISASDDHKHQACITCGIGIFKIAVGRFLIWIYRSRMLNILNLPFSW